MGRRYEVSKLATLQYYNIVGVDFRDVDIESISEEVTDLGYLSPRGFTILPNSSEEIDNQMLVFINTMCSYFGYSEEALELKIQYYNAFIGILNITSNLNLISEDSTDYELHFERLNRVLDTTMDELNNMDPAEVVDFYNLAKKGHVTGLVAGYRNYPSLLMLTLLGINSDCDIKDYTMFESENSSLIDWDKLNEIIRTINIADTNPIVKTKYGRLSYRKSLELSKNRK